MRRFRLGIRYPVARGRFHIVTLDLPPVIGVSGPAVYLRVYNYSLFSVAQTSREASSTGGSERHGAAGAMRGESLAANRSRPASPLRRNASLSVHFDFGSSAGGPLVSPLFLVSRELCKDQQHAGRILRLSNSGKVWFSGGSRALIVNIFAFARPGVARRSVIFLRGSQGTRLLRLRNRTRTLTRGRGLRHVCQRVRDNGVMLRSRSRQWSRQPCHS